MRVRYDLLTHLLWVVFVAKGTCYFRVFTIWESIGKSQVYNNCLIDLQDLVTYIRKTGKEGVDSFKERYCKESSGRGC
jgi:hypothetical protein